MSADIVRQLAANIVGRAGLLAGIEAGWITAADEPARELSLEEKRLAMFLQVAVPLRVQRFADRRWTLDEVMARGRELADAIASDDSAALVDPARRKNGGSGRAFNAVAEAVACASFAPGGLTFVGVHFESEPAWLARSA